jgi:hypothetical protein
LPQRAEMMQQWADYLDELRSKLDAVSEPALDAEPLLAPERASTKAEVRSREI